LDPEDGSPSADVFINMNNCLPASGAYNAAINNTLTATNEAKSLGITLMERSERMKLGLLENGEYRQRFRCQQVGIVF